MMVETVINIGLINFRPLAITILAPNLAPINCPTSMTRPIDHTTSPPAIKKIKPAKLEVKLSTLV